MLLTLKPYSFNSFEIQSKYTCSSGQTYQQTCYTQPPHLPRANSRVYPQHSVSMLIYLCHNLYILADPSIFYHVLVQRMLAVYFQHSCYNEHRKKNNYVNKDNNFLMKLFKLCNPALSRRQQSLVDCPPPYLKQEETIHTQYFESNK